MIIIILLHSTLRKKIKGRVILRPSFKHWKENKQKRTKSKANLSMSLSPVLLHQTQPQLFEGQIQVTQSPAWRLLSHISCPPTTLAICLWSIHTQKDKKHNDQQGCFFFGLVIRNSNKRQKISIATKLDVGFLL